MKNTEFNPGVPFSITYDRARATEEFKNLRAAVLSAAVHHYSLGMEHLRSQGGITAVMERAAAENGKGLTYRAPFGQTGNLAELLDYSNIRIEAQRKANAK